MMFIGTVDARGRLDPDVRVQIADYLRSYAGMTVEIIVRKERVEYRQRKADRWLEKKRKRMEATA